MLTLKIKRISHTHHTLEYKREDGTGESTELESKTFLMHDFVHYCVEKEAGLTDGFFGLLEKGCTYESLSYKDKEHPDCKVTEDIERVTGVMTGVVKGDATVSQTKDIFQNMYNAYNTPQPSWINESNLTNAHERYKRLMGEWNSLKFGETLELEF